MFTWWFRIVLLSLESLVLPRSQSNILFSKFANDYLEGQIIQIMIITRTKPSRSISMELLAFWSIAYASHRDFQGKHRVLKLLMDSLGICKYSKKATPNPSTISKYLMAWNCFFERSVSSILDMRCFFAWFNRDFLAERFSFTNLEEAQNAKYVRTDILDIFDDAKIKELITEMAPFVSIGTCYCPKNNNWYSFRYKIQKENKHLGILIVYYGPNLSIFL